ncbi:MAG: hypothetical protein AAFV29_23255 [Myxococcota bacterium]
MSSTGLDPAGWIDGGRAIVDFGDGKIELVGGNFSNFSNPNIFTRAENFDFNYLELEVSHQVSDVFSYEFSYEHINEIPFLRAETRLNLKPWLGHTVSFVGEGLANTENGALIWGPTIAFDVLELVAPSWKGYLRFKAFYSVASEDVGLRGAQSEDFIAFGRTMTFWLKGKIYKGFRWSFRAVTGDINRATVQLRYNFDAFANR